MKREREREIMEERCKKKKTFPVCLDLGVRLRVNSGEESVVVALWSWLVGNISEEELS